MAKTIAQKLDMPFGTVDRHIRVLLKHEIITQGSKKTGGIMLNNSLERPKHKTQEVSF